MKKKKFHHIKELHIPIYDQMLIIILSNSKKKVNKLIPMFGNDEIYATTVNWKWNESNAYFLVLNPNYEFGKLRFTHGVIAHECLHVVNMIFERIRIEADLKNDEPSAYLIEWLVDEVHKFVKEYGFEIHEKK